MSGVIIDVTTNGAKAAKDLDQINKSLVNIDKTASSSTDKLAALGRSLAGIVASGFSARYFSSVTSEFTNMGNKIALVTGRTEKLVSIQKQLLQISKETGSNASSTVATFSAFAKSLGGAAGSTKDLLKVTDAVQKAVSISGASVESARAAIVQLGQGLASGTLRGEELNSVLEQTPRVAKAIADSLEISTGELRSMAAAGNLTSDVVFQGLLKQTKKLNQEFALLEPTLDKSFAGITASIDLYIAQFDKGFGLSKNMAIGLEEMSKKIREASENAEALGTQMREKVVEAVRIAGIVIKPIMKIIEHMGRMLLIALPSAKFTRTILTDFKSMLYSIDKMFGGTFTKLTRWFQFGLTDLFDYDTEVEKAIKQLKRLSPTAWLTSGFDKSTVDEFFSIDTLIKYGEALDNLATAIGKNYGYIFAQVGDLFRRVEYNIRDFLRYILVIPDTLFTFRIGDVEAITYTIAEITRGISGVRLQIYEFGYLLRETFAPAYMTVLVTLSDMVSELPAKFRDAFGTSGTLLKKFGSAVKQMGKDFLRVDTTQIDRITGVFVSFGGKLVKSFNSTTIGKEVRVFLTDFKSGLASIFKESSAIESFSNDLVDGFSNIWSTVKRSFKSGIAAVIATISSYHASIRKAVREFLEPPTSWISGLGLTMVSMLGPVGQITAALLLVGKGLQSAISPSFADRVRDTFVDIIKWIYTFNESIAVTIATWLGLENSLSSSIGWIAGLSVVFGPAIAMAAGVSMAFENIAYSIGKVFRKGIIEQFISDSVALFRKFVDAVVTMAEELYNKVPKSVSRFSDAVIHSFWKIWDEVIAHSWWTDTINAVKDTSDSLWSDTQSGIQRFERGIINSYNRIYRSVSKTLRSFKEGENFSNVVNIGSGLKDLFIRVKDEMPQLFRAIASGVGFLFVTALFPAGALKKILQAELLTAAITGGAFFVEELSNRFANVSAIAQLGQKLGEAAGTFLGYLIKGLPAFVNAAATAVSGFIRGIASQIPVIGSLISGLFKVFDITGLGGVMGVVPLYLFGKAGMAPLMKMLGDDNPIKKFFTSIQGIVDAFGGSAISKFLFGSGAATNITAGLALIATHFGALDSMFQGSRILKGVVEGGLLWVALTGKTGFETIKSKALKAAHDIMIAIGKLAANNTVTQSIYDVIFKPSGGGNSGAVTKVVEAALKKVADTVVEFSSKIGKRGLDLATIMLFGTNSEDTFTRLKSHFSKLKDTVLENGTKIVDALRQSKIGEQIAAMYTGSGIGQIFSTTPKVNQPIQGDLFNAQYHKKQLDLFDVQAVVGGMKYIEGSGIDMSNNLNKSFAKTFGTSGLLGMLEKNKKAIFAMSLLMFSAFAMADDGARESFDKVQSAFDSLIDTLNLTLKENPIGLAIGATVLAAIPVLLFAFKDFARNAITSLNTVYMAKGITGLRERFAAISASALEATNRTKMLGAAVTGITAIGIGTAVGLTPENMGMLALALGGIFEMISRYWKGLPMLVSVIFATIGTIIKSAFVILFAKVLAVVGTLGIIGVLLFGKSEEKGWAGIVGKFEDIKTRILGLKSSTRSAVEEILKPDLLKFNNQQIFRPTDNDKDPANAKLGGIDYTKLNSKDRQRLESLAQDYADASKEAKDQFSKYRYLREDVKEKVRSTKQLLDDAVADLTDKTILDLEDFAEKLKKDERVGPKGSSQTSQTASEQFKLNIAYYLEKLSADIGLALAFTPQTRSKFMKSLESLEERKKLGQYDSNYFGLSKNDQKIQSSIEFLQAAGGDSILPDKLKKELKEALQNYETRRVEALSALGKAAVSDRYDSPEVPWYVFGKKRDTLKLKEQAYEQLQGPLETARVFAARKNDAKEFSAEMADVKKALDGAGLSMDKLDFYSKRWFESLRIDGGAGQESLKDLQKQLENATSEAERNEIIMKIRAIVDLGKVTKEQVEDSFKQVDVKLARLSEKFNLDTKSGILSGLGELSQSALYDQLAILDKLKTASFDLQNNSKLIEALIPEEELRKKVARSGESLRKYINEELLKIKDGLENQAPIQVKMKLAGVSLSDLAGMSESQIGKRIQLGADNALIEKRYTPDENGNLPSISGEQVAKDAKALKQNQLAIDRMKVDFKSISTIISEISNVAQGFSFQEAFRYSSKDLDALRKAGAIVADIEKQMNFEGTAGLSSEAVIELSNRRVAAEKKAIDIVNKYRLNTTDKLISAFSSAGISLNLEQLFRLPDSVIESYIRLEKKLFELKDKFARGKATEKDKEAYLNALKGQRKTDNEARGFSDRVAYINEAISDLALLPEEFEKLTVASRNAMYDAAINIKESEQELKEILAAGGDGQTKAAELARLRKQAKADAQNRLQGVMDFGKAGSENLRRFNLQVDEAAYNLLNGTQDQIIRSYVEQLANQKAIAENTELSRSTRAAAQVMYNDISTKIADYVQENTRAYKDSPIYQAGQTFADNVKSSFASGFKDLVTGKLSGKDFIEQTLDTFTNGIINAFVDGLMSSFNGKDGIFATLGESVFGLGAGIFGKDRAQAEKLIAETRFTEALNSFTAAVSGGSLFGVTDLSDTFRTSSKENAEQTARSINSTLDKNAKSTNSLLGTFGQSMLSFIGMGGAIGGAIGGKSGAMWGSGIGGIAGLIGNSDSWKAASALNDGDFFGSAVDWLKSLWSFDVGGVIPGATGAPMPILAHGGEVILNAAQQKSVANAMNGSTHQTFNINITGDISRQTKKEVMAMIPQIATGVNLHNTDMGSRR